MKIIMQIIAGRQPCNCALRLITTLNIQVLAYHLGNMQQLGSLVGEKYPTEIDLHLDYLLRHAKDVVPQ
jgi:hypothetical protein